jgi:hypothetical protein
MLYFGPIPDFRIRSDIAAREDIHLVNRPRISTGAVFENLAPHDLHAHVNYLRAILDGPTQAELFLGNSPIGIPIVKRVYKRRPSQIGLLVRSGSVGRVPMDRIVASLQSAGHDLRFRRSAKQRLVSQCTVLWAEDSVLLPNEMISALRVISTEVGEPWPPRLSLQYPRHDLDESLPGELRQTSAYRTGRAIGRFAGRVLSIVTKSG